MTTTERAFPSFSCIIYQEPKGNHACCGDSYYALETENYFVVAIADGLGSGMEARKASQQATALLDRFHHLPAAKLVAQVNTHLLGTRGVVFGVVKFFPRQRRAEYSGVGNVTFTLFPIDGEQIRVLPVPGYLDGRCVNIRVEQLAYQPGDRFVMYSDGLSLRKEWGHAFRMTKTPAEGLSVIQEHWEPNNDDMTVIVGR